MITSFSIWQCCQFKVSNVAFCWGIIGTGYLFVGIIIIFICMLTKSYNVTSEFVEKKMIYARNKEYCFFSKNKAEQECILPWKYELQSLYTRLKLLVTVYALDIC